MMTGLPQSLAPTSEEVISLPSGLLVHVPKATARFTAWQHDVPFDRYGQKAVLDFHSKPLFAELVILRLFEEAGWSGVWVDTYRRCFRADVTECVELSADKLRLLEQIYAAGGARSGCFDVFVWKEEEIMFAESKRSGRDKIRASQMRWLEGAVRSGFGLESFLVVEWSLKEGPNKPDAANPAIAPRLHASHQPRGSLIRNVRSFSRHTL
jgi:hypothetical protein